MNKKITKAILPVAGFGTRFLPASKNVPKEIFPIVDKPIIHYLVEEAILSGIKEIILITKFGKHVLEDYFDRSFELEYFLQNRKKHELLKKVNYIPKMAKFYFIRQDKPRGVGDAILMAQEIIGKEACAVLYGDGIIHSKTPALQQIIGAYYEYKSPVIALKKVPKKEAYKYGIAEGKKISPRIYKLSKIAEKPKNPFSNLAVASRYVITPDIFSEIKKSRPSAQSAQEEVWLTDAFNSLLKRQNIYGYEFEGDLYDCGSKLGYLQANIAYGLHDPAIKKELKRFIKNLDIN